MKRLFLSLCVIFMYFPNLLTADIYDDFISFRVSLYNKENTEELSKALDEWEKDFASQNLTEEEKLTLKNLFVLEKISVLKNDEKKIYSLLTAQDKECSKFMEGKSTAKVGKWFCLSYGNIKSRLILYASWLEIFNISKLVKQYYDAAIKKDKNFSEAHIANALSLFFAPSIAGGSYEAALKECNIAVSSAKNNEEKYLALLFRSQIHFELKHTKEYDEDLKLAHSLISNEIFTQQIAKQNKEDDKIFFE